MTAPAEFPCEFCGGQFAHVVCPITRPDHDCAQVERDNVDLHRALAKALESFHQALLCSDPKRNPAQEHQWHAYYASLQVLDRTSRPVA